MLPAPLQVLSDTPSLIGVTDDVDACVVQIQWQQVMQGVEGQQARCVQHAPTLACQQQVWGQEDIRIRILQLKSSSAVFDSAS